MKKIVKFFCTVIVLVLLLSLLSSCSAKLTIEQVNEFYTQALSESLKADIYYWKETIFEKGQNRFNTANVHTELDNKDYAPILDSNGDYKTLMINVIERINDKSQLEYFCGLANSVDKKNDNKNYLFKKNLNGDDYEYSKTQMSAKDFYNNEIFEKYLLKEKIKELQNLTVDDMDFSAKDCYAQKQINLIELSFKIKDSYFKKEDVDENSSLFANTSRVFVEITYGRITNITTYETENIEGKFSLENEKYKFQIVYLGPKIKLPKYDETVSKTNKSPLWKEVEIMANI